MSTIRTEALHLDRGHFQLRDVSLSIPEARITAIVGPNGSGKSTLLRLITRLLHPDAGEIYVQGTRLQDYTGKSLAQTVAMMPQAAGGQPEWTVREFVAYGRAPHKGLLAHRTTAKDTEVIDWALRVTGTERHAARLIYTLSGGEQQKVRIAMALAQKTDILLLDEPATYLDIAHQLDLMEMLRTLNAQHGLTIVMVLHDLQQAAAYCHHLIAMKRGEVVAYGTPQDIVTSAFLNEVYGIDAAVRFEEGYPLIIPRQFIPTHS